MKKIMTASSSFKLLSLMLLFIVIAVITLITLALGFRNPPLTTGSEWTCARMQQIKQEWDSLSQTSTKTKDEYDKLRRSLDKIIRKNLSSHNVRQLAASCDTLATKSEDRSDFENEVLRYVVRVLVASGDRDNLLKVLSTRCPGCIYDGEAIEYHLVLRGKKFKHPILILGEAYSKCDDEENRFIIATAVLRGFKSYGIEGKDDTEFVNNAMQWYKKEKDNLIRNKKYWHNTYFFTTEDCENRPKTDKQWLSITREPLFIKKD